MAFSRLTYDPRAAAVDACMRLPLSKSMAARLLVARWLGGGDLSSMTLPDCDDTSHLLNALRAVDATPRGERCRVYLGDGGTTLRFFTVAMASVEGVVVEATVSGQLAKRPLDPLLDALASLGGSVRWMEGGSGQTLLIEGHSLKGGDVRIDAGVSSQFLSALMLSAPVWETGMHLVAEGDRRVSWSYVQMTASVMEKCGAHVEISDNNIYVVPGGYDPHVGVAIEPDWSAAALPYELALALPDTEIAVEALCVPEESCQGDAMCAEFFGRLGVRTRFLHDGGAVLLCPSSELGKVVASSENEPLLFDMGDNPDLVPYMAVGMCLAGIRHTFINVAHLRHKECDRMAGVVNELRKLGYVAEPGQSELSWMGERTDAERLPHISTYGDHRMAMAFAPAAVRGPLMVETPEVVAKSFPDVWSELTRFGFQLQSIISRC